MNPSASPSRSERFEAEALVHLGPLYRTALHLTRNEADAQDLVQETVLRAYRFFDSFEPGTNCRAWLFRILMNTFVNEYRKRVRGPQMMELDETMSTLEGRADPTIAALPPTPEEVVFAGMLDGDLMEVAPRSAAGVPGRRSSVRRGGVFVQGDRGDDAGPGRDGHVPDSPGPARPARVSSQAGEAGSRSFGGRVRLGMDCREIQERITAIVDYEGWTGKNRSAFSSIFARARPAERRKRENGTSRGSSGQRCADMALPYGFAERVRASLPGDDAARPVPASRPAPRAVRRVPSWREGEPRAY